MEIVTTYGKLEAEFNRRQLTGEPCGHLVRDMIAVLSQAPRIIRFDVGQGEAA